MSALADALVAAQTRAVAALGLLDYFWVVTPQAVVRSGELPERWGLLEARNGRLFVAAQATRSIDAVPLDRSFVAALLRAACHRVERS